jgi:FAD/FMN-containing dehydrogenase
VEYLPTVRKVLAFQFNSLAETIEPLRTIQRKEIGLECFLINQFNLAAMFCSEWQVPEKFPAQKTPSARFDSLRSEVPPWSLVVCLNGAPELPEEKIAYEEEALQEVSARLNLMAYSLADREQLILEDLLRPWNILKKFCYRGSVHDVAFKSPLKRIAEFHNIILQVADSYGYPAADIGGYVLPVERGRGIHCEFDFHCDQNSPEEKQRIHQLWRKVSEKLIDEGAFFDRPYGAWANMMYSRTGEYTQKLKQLKKALDPNGILNPGHLCF